MVKRKSKKKKVLKEAHDDWHLKLAFTLGRTVKKASQKIDSAKKSSKKLLNRKRGQKSRRGIIRHNSFAENSNEPLSPILKELKGIADVSGLTAALEEMNEISLKHSSHPVVNRLVSKIKELSPEEQESLSRKFIDRIHANPYFNNAFYPLPSQTSITEEDCQKVSDAFIECVSQTLEDIGMTKEERDFLQKFSDDVTKPLNDLIQFYLHPKTFPQKVKRVWRIQRILIRMIKLGSMSQAYALNNAPKINSEAPFQGEPTLNYWLQKSDTQDLSVG